MSDQPWLHDSQICVHGNVTCVSDRDAEIEAPGTGLFVDDRRLVSLWRLRVGDRPCVVLSARSSGSTTTVAASARHLGDPGPDPTVEVHRERRLSPGLMHETITVRSRAERPVDCEVVLDLGGDSADLAAVKSGAGAQRQLAATAVAAGALEWSDDRHRVSVRAAGAVATPGPPARLTWTISLPPTGEIALELAVRFERVATTRFDADPGADRVSWGLEVAADDHLVDRWLTQSMADLRGLLMTDPAEPGDVFAAAGTPWYLTLFGRDSLWTARLMLPFGTELAHGTLRALARRQGVRHDHETGEEPGKILHEIRRTPYGDPASDLHLPPVYYGTVDATPLWLVVLHHAWRWGLDPEAVTALLPHAERAFSWMTSSTESTDDGLLRYLDRSGHGLSNQGWKDSDDAMRMRSGAVARPPIALLETQAYAVAAARGLADMLEALRGEAGDPLRAWADGLAGRVRERYWVSDRHGPYLAMALDGAGDPVDGVGSNMGHTIGTGLLTHAEESLVAARLGDPRLLGPFGLRTLSTDNPAYNPIGYHTGSIWTHDSAIAADALARAGFGEVSTRIMRGLLEASICFGFRLPELYGGEATDAGPIPYPASCRPQAWAAAAAPGIIAAALGLDADLPSQRVSVRPLRPAPLGALKVTGVSLGRLGTLDVTTDAHGTITHLRVPAGVTPLVP